MTRFLGLIGGSLILLAGGAVAGSSGDSTPPVGCQLAAGEHSGRMSEIEALFASHEEIRELEDGYAFRFETSAGTLLEIAEVITLEARCCPFLRFEIEVVEEGGPTWLRMSGREGVKEFLAAVMTGGG